MFTGIITDVGEVRSVAGDGDVRLEIATHYDTGTIELGASIACSGVCLTVVDKGGDWFAVSVSGETQSCTNLGGWQAGTPVNLERALKVGDELGGHILTGHVDGVGRVESLTGEGDSVRVVMSVPGDLAPFIAPKGSVAVDGVSLTVNEVDGATFGVNIIPHTQAHTTFGGLKAGDPVNIEIDVLARYVARLREMGTP